MTSEDAVRAPLSLDDVAAAALTVGAGSSFAARAARLLDVVRAWAEPSALLAFARDESAENGLRLLPELSAGHVGPSPERGLARLLDDAGPERLAAPWLIPPPPEVAGYRVKALDSWLLPWSASGVSGFLLLRGIPAPYPPNLAAAVLLASQGVWALVPARLPAEGDLPARLAQVEQATRALHDLVAAVRADLPVPAPPASEAPAPTDETVAVLDPGLLEQARQESAALRERCRGLEDERAEAELRSTQAQAETAALRIRVEEMEARLAAPPAPPEPGLAETEREAAAAREAELQAALEAARAESASLRESAAQQATQAVAPADIEALRADLETERGARAAAEAERETRRAEAEQAAAEAEELRTKLEAERLRRDTDTQSLEGARQALRISEEMLAAQTGELENLRRQRTAMHEQLEAAQRARAAAEAERDRARAEVNPLWATIESLQREIKEGQTRAAEAEGARLQELRAAHERALARSSELADALAAAEARAAAGDAWRATAARVDEAERRASELGERWTSGESALRAAWLALKRTPFVPPTLRLSFGAAQSLFTDAAAEPAVPGGRRTRVLLLDRDTPSLEPLAAELEAEGLDVLVAHYADEAAFFLKTPEARQLTAVLADVMAFRSDAELLERFRMWRLELPALGLLVSFRADDPAESERAKRVPVALGTGHLPRPLARQAVLDALAGVAKRAARRT